jgi:hypothetical protein
MENNLIAVKHVLESSLFSNTLSHIIRKKLLESKAFNHTLITEIKD